MKRCWMSLVLSWLLSALSAPAHADLLVSSLHTRQILRFDETSGAYLGVFASTPGGSASMTVGPGGVLYVGHWEGVERYDLRTGASLGSFVGSQHIRGAYSLEFGLDKNLFVGDFGGTGDHSTVQRYDGRTGAYLDHFVPEGRGGLQSITDLEFGPDGHLYVASRWEGRVLRYDGRTGEFIDQFASTGGANGLQDLLFAPDGMLYALDEALQQVQRFDSTTGAFIDVFATGTFGTDGVSMSFGPDGHLYVTSGHVGDSVLRYDGRSGEFLGEFVAPGSGGLDYATDLLFTSMIPEPGSYALFALGSGILALYCRRRRGKRNGAARDGAPGKRL